MRFTLILENLPVDERPRGLADQNSAEYDEQHSELSDHVLQIHGCFTCSNLRAQRRAIMRTQTLVGVEQLAQPLIISMPADDQERITDMKAVIRRRHPDLFGSLNGGDHELRFEAYFT